MPGIDTIAAISTPLGEGGIGIIRVSGPGAYAIAMRVFVCSQGKDQSYPEHRRLYLGHICSEDGTIIDEVLLSFMQAPNTYTREDTIEINCHSGIQNLRLILNLVLKAGSRLAEPGEFTRRAFVNGRLDLAQAESVLNMIRARSEEAVKNAARSLQGEFSQRIREIRNDLVSIRAPIEASFDYPEELDPAMYDLVLIKEQLEGLRKKIYTLLQGVGKNRAFQEGITIAIIGKPNVGKSSLLNALLRQQRAIVHNMPGTTRDLLEGYMNMGGYPLCLVDTAGIQHTCNPVEKIGIERARNAAAQANILVIVLDGSSSWTAEDDEIASLRRPDQGLVIVINKADLKQVISAKDIKIRFPGIYVVKTAAIKGKGIASLEQSVARTLDLILGPKAESSLMVSWRHEGIVNEALYSVDSAANTVGIQPLELVSHELQNAWLKLGEITGETASEALLDKIFSEFCLGK